MADDTPNSNNNYLLILIFDIAVGYFSLLKFNVLKQKNQALENALTQKQQENVAILLEPQNEKQQTLQKEELEWFAEKIRMFSDDEQKAILASTYAFAEHDLILPPSITIQLNEMCSQQELMYFVYSAFFNIGKKGSNIVSFLYQVFKAYFPARESTISKKMPGLDKVKEKKKRIRQSCHIRKPEL